MKLGLDFHGVCDTYPNKEDTRLRCREGHNFDKQNTYLNPSGKRKCRKCSAAWAVKWRKLRKRGRYAPRTHCRRGHLWDEFNTYTQVDHKNDGTKRSCRICKSDYMLTYKKRRAA